MRRRVPITLALTFATASSVFLAVGAQGASTTSTTVVASTSTTTTTTATTTTTTWRTRSVAPLTGLPYPKSKLKDYSALTIKIDNTPEAMPQNAIQDADVFYEEMAEGGIT